MKVGKARIARRVMAVILVLSAQVMPAASLAANGPCGPTGCGGGGSPKSISAAWVYSKDNADTLKSDIANSNWSDSPFLSSYTDIYIKNAAIPAPLQPSVNASYSENLSKADNFLDYSFVYDCTSSGIASTDLVPTAPHWTVHYTIALDPGTNFINDSQLKGHARYSEIVSSQTGQTQDAALSAPVGIGSGTLGAPSKCFPFTTGTVLVDNFAKLSAAQQSSYGTPATKIFQLAKLPPAATSPDNSCEASDTAGNFGWVLCPAIDLANSTVRLLVNTVIIPELKITPLQNSGDEYNVWNRLRDLSNVLFVLIFLVIIFANTLQFNVDAYAIKKVLPKLVAAAILIQFSYLICQIIVDIGNVLGQGIQSLIQVAVHYTPTTPDSQNSGSDPLLYGLGAAFDTAALIAIINTIGVPTIVIAVIGGLISVIGVVFTLVARQLIIIMLVVLSPLAFAAFVLPNTDRYFSVWLKMFIRVTLMFPLIILLLDVAAIGQNASSGSSLAHLFALIFPIIAFFMIPMTFKWAGGAMAAAAGGINKVAGRASKGTTQGLKNTDAYKSWKDRRAERKAEKLNNLATSDNRVKAYLGGVRQRGDFLAGRRLSPSALLSGQSPLQKDPIALAQARSKEREGWNNAKKVMENLPDAELDALAKGNGPHSGSKANVTAAQAILASRGRLTDDTLRHIVSQSSGSMEEKQRRLDYVRGEAKDLFKQSPARAMAPADSIKFGTDGKVSEIALTGEKAGALKGVLSGKSASSILDMTPSGIEDLSKTTADGTRAIRHLDPRSIAGLADKRQLSRMSKDMHDKLGDAIGIFGTPEQKNAWDEVSSKFSST